MTAHGIKEELTEARSKMTYDSQYPAMDIEFKGIK